MKKIALVLHGQGRSILSAHKSIKKEIIDVYKPDIFCHLWWDDEIKKNGYVGYGRHYIVDKDIPKIVTELYSPKKIVVEPKITDWETPELTNLKCGHYQTFISQLYSIQKACDLFDWSEYDFIIKCRYDLEIIKFPELDKLDEKTFYTGYDNGVFYYDNPIYFSDLCYIMPNDMKQFTQFIDNLNNYKIFYDCVPEHVIEKTVQILNFHKKMVRMSINDFYCDVIR